MQHKNFKNRVGEKFITNEGYTIEIVEYLSYANCIIQFDNGAIVKNKTYQNIVKGRVKNPYHKSVFGVGYFGAGKYSKLTNPKTYQTWAGMLERCYSEKFQEKQLTYKGVTVCEEWHNFQVFGDWFEQNYKEGFELDKDILIKGNKVYSPETCCFVPQEINKILIKSDSSRGKCPIGVSKVGHKFVATININSKNNYLGLFKTPEEAFQAYKTAKEKQIKEVAKKYKNQITEQTYQTLIGYKVEITD